MKIILLTVLLCGVLFAQPEQPELLTRIQQKYDSVSDATFSFTQEPAKGKSLSGTVSFKKQNNLRVDMPDLLLVSNGGANWSYNKKQNKVVISTYNESDPSMLSIRKIVYEIPKECTVTTVTNTGESVLKFIPSSKSKLSFAELLMWVDAEGLITKLQITESNKSITKITFTNYVLNKGLGDDLFTFQIPQGAKVIDTRDE